MKADLPSEMRAAAQAVTGATIDRLRSLGVRPEAFADFPTYPFGVARAEPIGGGLYQPSEAGLPSLVLPVLDEGELVDLVAFRATDPGGWMQRRGVGWCLGIESGVGWHCWRDTIQLHATPLDWLRADGEGLCITDWAATYDIRTLDVLPHIVTTSQAIADTLQRAMTLPRRLPTISVEGALRNVA